MTRKKLREVAILCMALVIAVIISLAYSRFASQQILLESVSHLDEIYTQINATFRSTITKNWRLLGSWRNYIADTAETDPDVLQAFIEEEKEEWRFTTFYFLSEDGNYMTGQGNTGYLDLGSSLERLVEERENIVVDGTLPSDKQIIIFAVPTQPGSYRGFAYSAIGISFNSEDMTSALSINAFSGESDCFITYADGRVLFSSQSEENQPYNLLAHLRDNARFRDVDADFVAQDWRDGTSRVVICELDGESFYLAYQPVVFEDWMLVSITPVDIVNAGMNDFMVVTLVVIGLLFAVLVLGIVSILILNNRHRMLEKNREISSREKLFDLLTENTDDIFVLFAPGSLQAEYISPNLERVLGLDIEAIRNDISPLFLGDADSSLSNEQEILSPALLERIPMGGIWTGERNLVHAKTRELRWFKQLLHHCSLEEQERYILMLSDRTQERQMNETLGEALNTAKAANEAKSNFLANMSHDIRTPMNAIVGFSVLLEKDAEKSEKVREYTKKISASSQHLLSLINDILDMSKIESGKTVLNMIEFSLPEMIEGLHTMMLPQARAKGQSLDLYTKGNLPERLVGDKLRLNQVLINLLSNAVKYTQEGGQISLSVEGLGHNAANRVRLRFIVADNGFGMSEAFVRTIFDPFTREVTDVTREIQGTGLGMAITKNIVDLMGGTIRVESEKGKGSTFMIELELPEETQQQEADFWQRNGITRMLVADDEEDICLNIQDAMEGTGVEVLYATNGRKAVKMVSDAQGEGNPFHILLLDWKMPGMDGLKTSQRIKETVGEKAPILVLTSYDLEEAKEAGIDAGIDLFLPKPFFLSSFQRAVNELLTGEAVVKLRPAQEISIKGLRVLAAEDNEINAEILMVLMEMEGVTCEVVSNGREAVDRFVRSQAGEFDMIFMDVQMPVMDGYEATRAIRDSSHPMAKSIPIIAMTANAFEEDIQNALTAGMNAHTAKPIDMDKLKEIVARLWEREDV
ncbi:MAG: response regulator [Candidatus Gastranaerophilales bacterium]|nr:response regulator [Candidatus Gastranaerophilales bacterium]